MAVSAASSAWNGSSLLVPVPFLPTSSVPLSSSLLLAGECTWVATGERVRLPSLPTASAQLVLEWRSPHTILQGYTAYVMQVALVSGPPAADRATAAVTCEMRLLNATLRSTVLVADTWAFVANASAPAGTTAVAAPGVTLQAAPGHSAWLQAVCSAWGQLVVSPPLRVTTATLALHLLSTLPSSYVASDVSAPWPLEPPLRVALSTVEDGGNVTDAVCALTTTTRDAALVIANPGAGVTSLAAVPGDPLTGVTTVPRFLVAVSPATPAVTLVLSCRRSASGDVAPALVFDVPAVVLLAALCTTPQSTATMATPLLPFGVGITATLPAGGVTAPCGGPGAAPPPLPPIVCTIALNTAASTINDTSSVFLQHTAATVDADTQVATFDALTLAAPQGQVYALVATCSVGGLAIPPPATFMVAIEGCPAGQEAVSVTCVTCGGGAFSLGGIGARCIDCPPAGVSCDAGILALRPNYYRPAGQAGHPVGPDTELHPCYNAEACTVPFMNASAPVYGCSYGYTGPLCGVCDADVNYARFGEACAVCWSVGASATFLAVVVVVVLAVLTRVALRTSTGRTDASIVLRITLSYLQAVGSLRVFIAGSTQAYATVMGWTAVVSASPLSVGALQCLLHLPYLVQYGATVLLPLLASAAVVLIFLAVTAARSLHCSPACRLDVHGLRAALAAWWASKRHLSTLLFVLFLAYMPITSASLRALDCIDPVAGIRYLRSDLSVECGVGQHAAARAVAYAALVVVGIGFPAGLA